MKRAYGEGCKARQLELPYMSPYARSTAAHIEWCAGWNDTDMQRYFVNDSTRLVRTDDTGTYKPDGYWRQVSLEEWLVFRAITKRKNLK